MASVKSTLCVMRVTQIHGPHASRCVAARVATLAPKRSTGFKYIPPPFQPEVPPALDIELPHYNSKDAPPVDVAIAGAGPAGIATAAELGQQGLSVVVVDPAPLQHWPNNYGVWCDEFVAMDLDDCFEHVWPSANVWLGDEDERTLARPYARVDRLKLKEKLINKCLKVGVKFHFGRAKDCVHDDDGSKLACLDDLVINASVVVDATGHARKLTKMDGNHNPGYQAAYGIMAEVESHPFNNERMLFMDWRDSHLSRYPRLSKSNNELPTFLYAMPFSDTRIFFEETSLVARPGVPFEELKDRLYARLKHLGVNVKLIVEEEYCLIPMGGVLPQRTQRVIGVGGTAGLVHPSTGYMVARTLGAVPQMSHRIVDEVGAMKQRGTCSGEDLDRQAQHIWQSIWPAERLRQREFMTFGMEVLLKLDLEQTRAFFSAFFALSDRHWRGFLSSQLGFTELFVFGLSLFFKSSNKTRLDLIQAGFPLLPGMFWNIYQAEKQLPENRLGQGEQGTWSSPSKSGDGNSA